MKITIKNIKDMNKRKYLYYLTSSRKIPTYFSATGSVQYDTKDLKEYKKEHKRGRPQKEFKGNE